MRRITLVFIGCLAIVIASGITVVAQTESVPASAATASATLSDAQKAAIKEIKKKSARNAEPLALRLAATVRRIYNNMLSDRPNEDLRIRLSRELQATAAKLLALKGQSIRETVNVLTPEQKRYVKSQMMKPDAPADLGELITRMYGLEDK